MTVRFIGDKAGEHLRRKTVRGKSLPLQDNQGMISRWEGRERRARETAGEMDEIKLRWKRAEEMERRNMGQWPACKK